MRSVRVFSVVLFLLVFLFPEVIPTDIQGKLELENFQRTHNDSISDLIFLLDTSGSLWYYDYASRSSKIGFDDEKVFVNSLLSQIRISLPSTRVSVALFGTDATLDINYVSQLDANNHKCNFKKSFQALKFRSGLTNMHDAFQYAYDIIFGTLSADKRPNQLAKTAVFVLTDGMWNRGGDPYPIAKKLKDGNIEIFSIGVTNGVNMNVMRQLATDNSHAFHYSSFTQFRELANYLRGDPYERDWELGQTKSLCGSCDNLADCACGLLSGEYKCSCYKGFYGSGYTNDCHECPYSTYKDFTGYAKSCIACPANSRHSRTGSSSRADCHCLDGYDGNPAGYVECKIRLCDQFPVPLHGMIKGGQCNHEYQSTCELICKTGYELNGNGKRTCAITSQGAIRWSGSDPQCNQIVCPLIQVTNADPPSGTCSKNDLSYGTTCTFKCDRGYILQGNPVRQCQQDKTWSGSENTCEPVKCPKLNSISLSQVTPPECVTTELRFDSHCVFECPKGYLFEGTRDKSTLRFCQTDGTWTGEHKPCVDSEPPVITCPEDIRTNNSLHQDHAVITWVEPAYSDNSLGIDPLAQVTVTSNFKSGQKFLIGQHTVQYTVRDRAGLTAKCSFDVEVLDNEAPYFTSCPEDKLVITTELSERVPWVIPEFLDNSNKTPIIEHNKNPGTHFYIGEVFVYYVARDQSGNVNDSCAFLVHVKAKSCEMYPPPINGALACNAWGVSNRYCQVSCNEQFDFAFPPAINYLCGSGKWTTIPPSPVPWPDCSVRYTPDKARMALVPQFFYYSGDCNSQEAQDQIKLNFVNLLNQIFVPSSLCRDHPADCTVDNVNVFCGATTSSKRRRRQSVREVYVRVDIVAQEKPSAGSKTVSQLEQILDNDAKPLLDQQAKSFDWSPLRSSTDLEYQSFSITDAEAYCSDAGAVVGKCDSLDTGCDGLSKPHILCQCNKDSGAIEKCIRCPKGTYYDLLHEECIKCSPGSFQSEEGRFECNKCPEGTSTVGEDSKNFTACREKCKPGFFSPNGLAKCFPCSSGTYASGLMNTNCTSCPAGTTTILPAAGGREECGMKCAPGTYSENGVEPCVPCAQGSYQSGIGALACVECTGGKSTYGPGADAADMCVAIDDCLSNPCNNGGTCSDLKDDILCECQAGYSGKFCENENDDCLSDPCYQGATCVDKVNGYECVCAPGFSGLLCDVPSQVCSANVCQNGAKCVVQPPDFICECPSGYGGKFCEMKIDHCCSSPCHNYATCKSLAEGYQCSCRPGYEGVQCERNTDECASDPCQNNGTCVDGDNRYTCTCKAGFTGVQCETTINECLMEPCHNGGQCVDKENGFECICKPTYSGDTCTKKLCFAYDLSFPLRIATSSSSVYNIPDLKAFTIAFWLRTDDTENPGTPLSYSNVVGGKLQDNALVIQDYGAFELHINNEKLFIGTSANDGKWNHVAVTWDSNGGKWIFYKNGQEVKRYSQAFQSGAVIRGGGVMVLGQEQDSLGGSFSPEEAFTGDLSQLNVWDKVLSPQDIYNLVRTCHGKQGNVKAWADFRVGLQGVYVLTSKPFACLFTSALRGFSAKRDARLANNDDKVLSGKTAEQCADACEKENSFPCRSFDYDRNGTTCYLSRASSGDAGLMPVKGFDYYQTSCTETLGVQSKAIPDSAMTASSSLASNSQPKVARLYAPQASGLQGVVDSRGGWSPQTSDQQQYLQIDLSDTYKVTGVATQGGDGLSEWVTSYKLQYTVDDSTWQYYSQTLSGNTDSNTVVKHEVQTFTAKMVRIRPQTWNVKIALRVEVYGCLADPIPPPPTIAASRRKRRNEILARKRRAAAVSFLDIHVRSEGCDDPGRAAGTCGVAYIKVNGQDHSPHGRGHNVVILDAITGAVLGTKAFDTHGDNSAGNSLRDYLNAINGDKIVLVAIQDAGATYISSAIDALKRLGATDPILTELRSSFAFVGYAQANKPSWIAQEQHNRYEGPSEIFLRIPLTQSHQTPSSINIEVRSEGCEDPGKTGGCGIGSIKVDNQEYSLKIRGFNVAVFAEEGLFMEARSFDTHGMPKAGPSLTNYLNSLSGDKIVLVAVQDEASRYGTVALSALKRLGAKEPIVLDYRGSFVLAGYAGSNLPSWVNQAQNKRGEGPSSLTATIEICDDLIPSARRRKRRSTPGVNECSTSPCKNGGKCFDLYYSFRCHCASGYEGDTCQLASSCSELGVPLNGQRSSSNYNHGSTITFSCNAGFSLHGSASRTCSHGQWSGTRAECKDVDECAEGRCTQQCVNTLGGFMCSCNPGYSLNNDGSTCDDVNECSLGLCSHSCHNSPGTFRCSCPTGMELAPGGRSCRDKDECTSNNGGCEHICANSYLSYGCHCRGGYTAAVDNKNCDEKLCPSITAPANGAISIAGDPILGNIATFNCHAGYQLKGSQKRLCLANGQWSGVQPTCNAGRCIDVGTVKYGTGQGSGTSYGSSVSFSCNSGYGLVGSAQRLCEQNGIWSDQQPRCVRADCPQLSAPAHGSIEGYRRETGSTVRVSCEKGYKVHPDSSSFRSCQADKQWSGVDPICQLIDCDDPGTPWHGYLHGADFHYGSTVTFSCRPQHHLEGDSQRTCQGDGQWSGQQPKCLERSCGNPGSPANGMKIGTNHSYGASIEFTCNQGYTLQGSQQRTCLTTGQWSGSQPTCQIVSCGDPGSLANGFRIGDKFTYEERVIYDCNAGYKLQGSIIRKCEANGQWSGSTASCVASNCGKILHGPSGTFQSSNFPNNYPNNEYCTWEIQVPQGKKVRLEFEELRTEENKDFVFIYDTGKTDPVVAFSGVKDKPRAITSSGNSLRVRFIANGDNSNNGFKVSYRQTDCGGILISETGEIRSPGFPNGYPPNLSCTWLIFISNKRIGLTLNEFKTENAYDRLEVAHGPWVTASLEIAWSGPSPLSGQVVTTQYMWVHFITSAQDNGVYKGFRATYKPYVPYSKKR